MVISYEMRNIRLAVRLPPPATVPGAPHTMPVLPLNDPRPLPAASDLVGWLSALLDAAWSRDDMPLARVIAGVVDDLARAQRAGAGVVQRAA